MRRIVLIIMCLIIFIQVGCARETATEVEPDRNFYYKDTKWGMGFNEVESIKGVADGRNRITDDSELAEGEQMQDDVLLDLYYDEQIVFEKFTFDEKYQFDENDALEGVIATMKVGTLADDLTNMDELNQKGRTDYMELRETLISEFGEPAAEYTAYRDGSAYSTEETLDLENDNAFICASRWDGDNLRFIYILFFVSEHTIELRYIPHDEETVNRVDSMSDSI